MRRSGSTAIYPVLSTFVLTPLGLCRVIPGCQVLRVARESEAAGGDEYAFLHNMVTSLGLACSVLCAVSAFAVVSRNAQVMVQTTAFQAVIAPGLALCGVLLFGSSAAIATGATNICWERWMHCMANQPSFLRHRTVVRSSLANPKWRSCLADTST